MLGDSLLDAAIKEYQPVDVEGAITGAQKYQENQNTLQGQKQALQEGQLKLGEETEETPLRTALVKEQAKNSLLSDAIAKSTDAQSWDANMRKLSQQFPEATQYIGRYTPVLQSRLMSVYSGQPGGAVGLPSEGGLEQPAAGGKGTAASAGGGSANLDYQFAQTTPDQRAQALKSISAASDGLEQVGSAAEWDALKARLHAAGVPMMDQIGDYSPIKAASIYQRLQPLKQYLENRAIADQAGIPAPKPAPDIRTVGNSLFSVDPYGGTAKQIGAADKYASAGPDMMGNPQIYDSTTGKIVQQGAGDRTFGFDDFAKKAITLENAGGDRTAKNPNSSATGNGQFTDKTWLQTIKASRPELAQNMSDAQLLQLRKDPAISEEMTAENAKTNANILAANGQHVNATSLMLAHRFGPQGALGVLAAAPDTPLSSILSADAVKANPGLANQTAGQYVQDLSKKAGLDTIGQPTGNPNAMPTNISPDMHGNDLLQALPQTMGSQVKALAEGRMAFPSGFALKTPYWQNMLRMVSQYDPNFDAVNYNARSKTRNWITSGQGAQTVTALNTALGHAAGLADNFDKLGNTQFPMINAALNFGKTELGNAQPTVVKQNIDALASEGRKVFAASGGGNLTELDNWKSSFPINGSPEQQKGALKEFVSLLDSRMNAVSDQYNRGMGTTAQPLTLLSPTARAAYSRLTGEVPEGPAGGGAPAPKAATPAPGRVIRYNAQGQRMAGGG